MRRFLPLLILVPGMALAAPLANVNGQPVTEGMVQAANSAAANNPEAKKQTVQVLVARMLLAQQAEKKGWDKTPAVRAALATQRLAILSSVAAQHYWARHPITHSQLEAAYQKALTTLPNKEYRLREILVSDRATAEHLLTELQHGGSFSQLAAQHSLAGNAAVGGESGWIADSALPAAFLKIMKEGKMGEDFGPVALSQGWAIVQKLGERTPPKPSLTQVQGQLETSLRNQDLEHYVQHLKKLAHIHVVGEKSDAAH